jgi:tetratricopeptide (TPR) repeat protein
MYRKTGEYSEALKLFTRVIVKLPDDKSVYLERGLVYQEMGNHTFAINDFKKAIELDSMSSLAYFYIGTSKLKSRSMVRDAIDDFKKSESLDQTLENAGIYDGLG